MLIVFCGIDGSGKSSHSRAVREWLTKKGFKVYVDHFYRYLLITPLSILKYKLGIAKKIYWGGEHVFGEEFKRHIKKSPLARLRPLLAYFDNILYFMLRALPKLLTKHVVIFDRYFYDHLFKYKALGYDVTLAEKLYLKLVPKPRLIVVFDVPAEIAYERKKHEHPLWHFKALRNFYLEFARRNKLVILDTRAPFGEIQEKLEKIIARVLALPST